MPLVQRQHRPVVADDSVVNRPALFYVCLVVAGVLFIGRLFYLEVIRGDYYRQQAMAEHQKKFEIPARRGVLYARDGNKRIPIVLNETKRLVYADTRYVRDKRKTAELVAKEIGGEASTYERLLNLKQEYVVLAKNVPLSKGDALRKRSVAGIGQTDTPVRVYPQGQAAAQVLGFVNGDGEGQYGVEEYLNSQLKGQTGLLKAVTDVNGVPLASGESSVQRPPQDGKDAHLTIDINLQRSVEEALKAMFERSKAKSASAVVLEAKTGAVRAMGNYPTFNPNEYTKVAADNYGVFSNRTISVPYEAGSVMKIFTMATALDKGVVTKASTFPDSGSVKVEDRTIKNSRNWGNANRSMTEVMQLSLNTGVVFLFQQLGDGRYNEKGRTIIHDYFTGHFRFGQRTGVQLAGESGGGISKPTTGDGDNVRYANMTFGQGMTVTQLQIASGLAAIVNGGTYYKPSITDEQTKQVVSRNAVGAQVGSDLRDMMRAVIRGTAFDKPGYYVGGKSGTAQLLDNNGNYTDEKTTASYTGFIGSKDADYVIMVRVDEPDSRVGFSGTTAAAPLFSSICDSVIQYYGLSPGM